VSPGLANGVPLGSVWIDSKTHSEVSQSCCGVGEVLALLLFFIGLWGLMGQNENGDRHIMLDILPQGM